MSIIKQYFDYQKEYDAKYKKALVLMQIGSFHEAYCTDNEGYNLQELSDLLNIVCTKKDKSVEKVSRKNPRMLGFPSISLSKFLKILVDNGYTVIVIDQVTPPPKPKRKVTGIYSKGTYIDDNINANADANNIVSLYIVEEKQLDGTYLLALGLSSIDLSTGKNMVHEVYSVKGDEKLALDDASRFIKMNAPKEVIVLSDPLLEKKKIKSVLLYLDTDDVNFIKYNKIYKKLSYQKEFLNRIFVLTGMMGVLEYLEIEKMMYARTSYISLLNFAYEHNEELVKNISKPVIYEDKKKMVLGNDAVFQLNVLKDRQLDTKGNKFKCLFDVVNNMSTSVGKRYLREVLTGPLINNKEIEKRYKMIDYMIEGGLWGKISKMLKNVMDVERLHRKMALRMLHPMEFYNLHHSYTNILSIYKCISGTSPIKFDGYDDMVLFMKEYSGIFDMNEMKKYVINDIYGSIFNVEYDDEIRKLQENIDGALNFMENVRAELDKLVIDKIKSGRNKVNILYNARDGYFLSLTKLRATSLKKQLEKRKFILVGVNKKKIRVNDFEFKSLAKGNTKIFLNEMNSKSDELVCLKDKMKNLVKDKYVYLLEQFYGKYIKTFNNIVLYVRQVDFACCGAKTATKYNYCRPTIHRKKHGYIKCKNLRHPIVERIQTDTEYIPNDLTIGRKGIDGMLLYGLNSSGKTVLMKAVGMSIILAQCGMFVPAKEYHFSPYYNLITRITGNDNLFKGLSSFALEMVELGVILKRSTRRTLVIGDEISRGTEPTSGSALVAATIISLSKKKTSFMFASHLHDIPNMERIKKLDNVKCFHLQVDYDKDKDSLIFNRKLVKGVGDTVYGLTVARYLIHDIQFINLANDIKKEILGLPNVFLKNKTSVYNSEIYVNECKICKKTSNYEGELDTHHINFQKDCKNGFVIKKEYIMKNSLCNLVVLCKNCHRKVHSGEINIDGYKETSNGRVLTMG